MDYPSYFEKIEPKTAKIRYSFLKIINKNKKILLIGESDTDFIKKIKKKFLRVRICNIESLPSISDKFDVILCYMVLEHVGNIKKFIKKIKQLSNYKCKLFLGVPDSFRSFNSSFEGEHLNHFEKNNLKFFLQRHYGKVNFLKKTRNDDISVVSENNKNFKKNILNNANLYKQYLQNYNNSENELKKIISEINKFDTVGLMPLNQVAIDILQNCKGKKIFLFDKFKNIESLEKIKKKVGGGRAIGKFMDHEIYKYNNVKQLAKCEMLLITKSRFQKEIFYSVKSIINNKAKIIRMR